ncbi:MAG: 2-oxoglutarate and iron-dependent oxygenase domain-containing protein [Candidatus Poseidoniaceae archaeon]|jgi:isopenicillin N synthase-like dioxygenase|nr:2-oxoglutarate and iron-dependent oxygenase domain-containing protein [Candidatus Poseidoniaceae archaeon]
MRSIPVVDYLDFTSGDEERKSAFIQSVGDSLKDIGFFALKNHGIPLSAIEKSYEQGDAFFSMSEDVKRTYLQPQIAHQRGYTAFGIEHAKNNPAPDLKEFWQTGRSHPTSGKKPTYVENVWPETHLPQFREVIDDLFSRMENVSQNLLQSCSLYLGKPKSWLGSMAEDGNTIMRIIHYPPLGDDVQPGAVRSAEHEDINFITLLVTATADGLEVMDHDGSWIKVEGDATHIIVDSGDMLQNLTNGLFKSTTHRVVNPANSTERRFSMPMFVHPRNEIDLTPRQEFIEMTGGKALFQSITAGDYLHQRLVEIGLAEDG